MTRCIYKIINVKNNHYYLGSAANSSKRKARHFSDLRHNRHPNNHLQNAWNKYGENSFVFAIVQYVAEMEDILEVENEWLRECVGKKDCYNIGTLATAPSYGLTGEKSPTWGYRHTEDARSKIGIASKTRIQSDEEKAKRIATMQGHEVSTATREKLSKKLSGEGNYWYGKKRPEHGAKVSRSVEVTDPKGNKTTYASIQELREATGLKPPTVNRALKSGKPLTKGPFAGYSFK